MAREPRSSISLATEPRLLRGEDELARMPASERIRYRLVSADRRHHANDNIAEFVRPGELEEVKAEVAEKMREVLRALVIDTESDHNTQDTARRVAKMYVDEVFRGRFQPMPAVTEFPNAERLNELMIVGPITVRSASHTTSARSSAASGSASCPMSIPT